MSEGACYQSNDARDIGLVSLLRVAHRLFSSASVIQALPRLVELRTREFPIAEFHELFLTLDPPFLDAFKIATSFENLFKAELLDFGYVVHKIDKRANARQFEALGSQQALRPIHVTEIRAAEGATWMRRGPFTIASLGHETLTLGLLISEHAAYWRSLRLAKPLRDALDFVRTQRNTVHFVVNDSSRFNNQIVDWYLGLRSAMNTRLLPRYRKVIMRYPHLKSSPALALNEI